MGETAKTTVRYQYIDQQKGLAMLMVVIGHFFVFCGLDCENLMIDTIVLINMPLFLFLNGLVVRKLTYDNQRRYLFRKFRQIMLPFFLWGGILTLFRHETYANFINGYWKFGYWYLLVLFEFYIIIGIINLIITVVRKRLSQRQCDVLTVLMFGSGYVIMRLAEPYIPVNISVVTCYYQAMEHYPYFVLGIIIRQFGLTQYIRRHISVILATTLVLTAAGYYLWHSGLRPEIGVMALRCVMILFIMALFMTIESANVNNRLCRAGLSVMSTIGRHTLSIYVLQYFFFCYINLSDVYGYLMSSGNTMAVIIISTVLSVAMCYMCIAIEKVIGRCAYLRILIGK